MFKKGYEDESIWQGVPEPEPQVAFIVDEPENGEFTVVAHKEVAGHDVAETIYDIDGVWRVRVDDLDDHPELPSAVFSVVVDRRYKVDEVRQAVIKLLENLYNAE
jgi:hypothetical protein